jgi:uncharacterized protein (DUF1499 family)
VNPLVLIVLILSGTLALGSIVFYILLTRAAKASPKRSQILIGVADGEFQPLPNTPNCVSTQAEKTDKVHYVSPIPFLGLEIKDASHSMLQILLSFPRVTVVQHLENYIWAEFKSKGFGFIDDVEIYFPDNKKYIEYRSASRIGTSDFGVNRARYEKIKARYEKKHERF